MAHIGSPRDTGLFVHPFPNTYIDTVCSMRQVMYSPFLTLTQIQCAVCVMSCIALPYTDIESVCSLNSTMCPAGVSVHPSFSLTVDEFTLKCLMSYELKLQYNDKIEGVAPNPRRKVLIGLQKKLISNPTD